jgi:hypothetical protein
MDDRRAEFVSLHQKRKMGACDQHTGNRIVAKIIPVLLAGGAGFTIWVFTAQICGMSLLTHGNKKR